jgi:hypothetical protein
VRAALITGEQEAKDFAEADGMKPPNGTYWWERTEAADDLRQAQDDGNQQDGSDQGSDGNPDDDDGAGGAEGGDDGDDDSDEDSDSDDDQPLVQVRNAHLLAQGADLLNGMLEGDEGQVTFPSKVWVEEARIHLHKKTVMKQAHDGSTLSNDRVQRARAAHDRADRASRVWSLREDVWSVKPGNNVSVLFQNPARAFVGRITRVRKKGTTSGWVEYRYPVALADRDALSEVYFQCYWYKKNRRRGEWTFAHADPAFIVLTLSFVQQV